MSYPDEYEEQVEAMLDDLAAADAIPESIKYANEVALKSLRETLARPSLIARAILEEPRR